MIDIFQWYSSDFWDSSMIFCNDIPMMWSITIRRRRRCHKDQWYSNDLSLVGNPFPLTLTTPRWNWGLYMGVSINGGTPIAGWFIMEFSTKTDDLGVPPFQETTIFAHFGFPKEWREFQIRRDSIPDAYPPVNSRMENHQVWRVSHLQNHTKLVGGLEHFFFFQLLGF